jgi:hypothetical protein
MKFIAPLIPREVQRRITIDRPDQALAAAETADQQWLVGTRGKLIVVGEQVTEIPWHEIEDATWDADTSALKVKLLRPFGEPEEVLALRPVNADRLVQLLRERVMASIVSKRRVDVDSKAGFTVIGRRDTLGGPVIWMTSYDAGLDPQDPRVAAMVDQAVELSRYEVGS